MLLISQPSHLHLSPNNTLLQKYSPPAVGDVGQAKSSMRKGSSQHASDITIEPSESQQHCVSKKNAARGGRCWANEERYAGKETFFPVLFQGTHFYFFGRRRGAWIKGNTSDAPPGGHGDVKAADPFDFPTSVWGSSVPLSSSFPKGPFYFFGRRRGAEIKGDTSDAPLSTLNSCNYKHKTLTAGYLEGCRCLPAPAWTTLGWQRGPN